MKNKLRMVLLAGLSIVTVYSAFAESNNWYVSAADTTGWKNDSKFTTTIANPDSKTTQKVEHDTTFGTSLAVGRIMNEWRVELESSYRQNKLEDDRFITKKDNKKHDIRSGNLSFMINAYYDIPVTEIVSFYLGAGAGASLVYGQEYNAVIANKKITQESWKYKYLDTAFAWQGMAGITFALTERVDLYSGYRVFATTKPINNKSKINTDGAIVTTEYRSKNIPVTNNVEVGIRFKF